MCRLEMGKIYILHTLCLTLNKTVIIAYCGFFTLYNKATCLLINELMKIDIYILDKMKNVTATKKV